MLFAILATVLARILLIMSTQGLVGYGDNWVRLWTISKFVEAPSVLPNSNWSPVYFYFHGLLTVLTNELFYTTRIVTALFSLGTMIPLYLFTRNIYSESVAKWAVIIFAFWDTQWFYSVGALSEPSFLFCTAWAIHYFVKFYKNGCQKSALWSAFWIMMAGQIRMEAWPFSIILWILMFRRRASIGLLIICGSIISLAPFYEFFTKIYSGYHPLHALTYSDQEVRTARISAGKIGFWKDLRFVLVGIPEAFGGLPFICGLVGAFWSLTKKKYREVSFILLLLFLCSYLMVSQKVFAETLAWLRRYYFTASFLLIPFGALIYERICKRFFKSNSLLMLFVVLVFLGFRAPNQWKYLDLISLSDSWVQSVAWARENLTENDHLIVDIDTHEDGRDVCGGSRWAINSGIPVTNYVSIGDNRYPPNVSYPGFKRRFVKHGINMIHVCKYSSKLTRLLNVDHEEDIQERRGYRLQKIYSDSIQSFFKVLSVPENDVYEPKPEELTSPHE